MLINDEGNITGWWSSVAVSIGYLNLNSNAAISKGDGSTGYLFVVT